MKIKNVLHRFFKRSSQINHEITPRVLIFTGAGISAESGMQTFRGANGLWNGRDVMEICSVEGFHADPDNVNAFYDDLRVSLEDKQPNNAHMMIADLSNRFPDRTDVITQNIDDLFEKAGCSNVTHLHGTLTDLRCSNCQSIFRIGYRPLNQADKCPSCGSTSLRHNVVMFGEPAPNYSLLNQSIDTCHLLVVIGTSGNVININKVAHDFEWSILCNLDADPDFDINFDEIYHMEATKASKIIERKIISFLNGQ